MLDSNSNACFHKSSKPVDVVCSQAFSPRSHSVMLNAASGGIITPLEETHRGRNELETAAAEVVIGGG